MLCACQAKSENSLYLHTKGLRHLLHPSSHERHPALLVLQSGARGCAAGLDKPASTVQGDWPSDPSPLEAAADHRRTPASPAAAVNLTHRHPGIMQHCVRGVYGCRIRLHTLIILWNHLHIQYQVMVWHQCGTGRDPVAACSRFPATVAAQYYAISLLLSDLHIGGWIGHFGHGSCEVLGWMTPGFFQASLGSLGWTL